MAPNREWFARHWASGDNGEVQSRGGVDALRQSPLWGQAATRWRQAGNGEILPDREFGAVLYDVWYDDTKAGVGTATERWFTPVAPPVNPPVIPPPVTHDPTVVNGNFLALPGFELDKGQIPGFMYPAMHTQQQRDYRALMRQSGYTTVPFSPFARYRQWSYTLDPESMRTVLRSLRADGLAPLAFLLTDHLDGHAWTLDEAKRHLDRHLPVWKDSAVSFALCWEIDQVRGLEHERTQLALAQHARDHLGANAMLWDHRQPGWWGPGLTDGGRTEWDYWRNTACDGLLGQQRLGQDVESAMHEWLESDFNGLSLGIAGRLTQRLNKRCAMFEFARNTDEWTRRKRHYENHLNGSWLTGYC
jgi:hypothetical protein